MGPDIPFTKSRSSAANRKSHDTAERRVPAGWATFSAIFSAAKPGSMVSRWRCAISAVVHNYAIFGRNVTDFLEPKRASLDQSPQLTAAFLKRQGFVDEERIKRGFVSRGLEFLVEKEGDGSVTIYAVSEGTIFIQEVEFDVDREGTTWKPYFICPIEERNCTKLYYHYGVWASRRAHGIRAAKRSAAELKGKAMADLRDQLLGARGRKPARGMKRQALLTELGAELDRIGFVPATYLELGKVFEQEEAARRKQLRRKTSSPRPREATLDHAIRCGRAANDEEAVRYKTGGPAGGKPSIVSAADVVKATLAALEDCPSVDLQTLRKRNWLEPGWLVGYHLIWPDTMCDRTDILMFVDMRNGPELVFEFAKRRQPASHHQRIAIVEKASMPGRQFLRCPVLGTDHQELFLRNGYFASPRAHRLNYRSQL